MSEKGDELMDGEEKETVTQVKIVAVGDGAVGKTCMLMSFANNTFPDSYIPTVFDNYTTKIIYEDKPVVLELFDTAGQPDYDALRPLAYDDSTAQYVCFLICFSIADPDSFDNCRDKWVPEIVDHPVLLVGLKTDLRDDPKTVKTLEEYKEKPVSIEVANARCKDLKLDKYVECSAKTTKGLKEVFEGAVEACLKNTGKKRGDKSKSKLSKDSKKNGKGCCSIL